MTKSEYLKNQWQKPEYRNKMREVSLNTSNRLKELWKNPEYRAKQIDRMKGLNNPHWNPNTKKFAICIDCNARIYKKSNRCRKCNSKFLSGSNAPNWKGGITKIVENLRHSSLFAIWRKAIFEKDNYTCQMCGRQSGDGERIELHPHHIFSFARYPERRFDILNGITLCRKCHYNIHHYGGVSSLKVEWIIDSSKNLDENGNLFKKEE